MFSPRVELQRINQQRCAIKFCVKLNKFNTETFVLTSDVHKGKVMSTTRILERHNNSKMLRKMSKVTKHWTIDNDPNR